MKGPYTPILATDVGDANQAAFNRAVKKLVGVRRCTNGHSSALLDAPALASGRERHSTRSIGGLRADIQLSVSVADLRHCPQPARSRR
jgi:hypothetical protein